MDCQSGWEHQQKNLMIENLMMITVWLLGLAVLGWVRSRRPW